jgi:membrane protease YdiL (CAAX protease family)
MKRILLFARSVTPQDPSQLLLLAGSVLLLICMELRCHPLIPEYENPHVDPGPAAYQLWLLFSVWARLPIFFAGAAGLSLCFWPGINPVRRITYFVVLPSVVGMAAICARFLYVAGSLDIPVESVTQRGLLEKAGAIGILWSLGPALHMSILGLVFVLFFLRRLATGASRLPVSLAHNQDVLPGEEDAWERIPIFLFISITCVPSITNVNDSIVGVAYGLVAKYGNYRLLPPGRVLSGALVVAFLAGIAAWAAGEGRWKELRQFLRPPEIKFGMLGLIIPTAIEQMPDLLAYILDRVRWAAFYFGKLAPPVFSTYFDAPNPFYYWWLIAAALQEVVWRGYLQPHFVRRFGLIRGIFLIGVSWGAYHFLWSFTGLSDDFAVVSQLALRLANRIVMSYVLGWLTMRTRSIWPAALAHGFSNVWISTTAYRATGMQSGTAREIIVIVCWALLGFLLFRYWPPTLAEEDSGPVAETAAEPSI